MQVGSYIFSFLLILRFRITSNSAKKLIPSSTLRDYSLAVFGGPYGDQTQTDLMECKCLIHCPINLPPI